MHPADVRWSVWLALPARVGEIGAQDGPVVDIRLAIEGGHLLARLTRRSIVELGLTPGRPVFAVIKSVALDRHGVTGAPRAPHDDPADRLDG